MLKLWIRTGFLALLAALAGCASQQHSQAQSIKGELTYLQKVALPIQSKMTVQLVDVSKADAPAEVLTEYSFDGLQVPLLFVLDYDQSQIQPGHTYAITGRVEVGDQLWFINTTQHSVDLSQPVSEPVKIVMDLVRN